MNDLTRPSAIHKITPPYTSQVRHLTPAEARGLYEYIVWLEMEAEHYRDLATAVVLTAVKQEEAT